MLRLLRPRPLESRCFARLENSITSKEESNALDHPGDSDHSLVARFYDEDWRRPYSLNPGNRADHFDYSIGDWAARLTCRRCQGKEGMMSEQQSQKRGVRSEAQKEYEAREDPYDPKPSSNEVGGAVGNRE